MFSAFESFRGLTKCSKISIDNLVFKLHYRFTHLFLVISSVLITGYQYWGNPISCRTSEGEASQSILDFCWVSSTFTLPAFTNGRDGKDFVAPGVAGHTDNNERKYHTYYQWVCIVLFGQAIFFYLPHFIWKRWEKSKMKYLVQDLSNPTLSNDDKSNQIEIVVDTLDSDRSYQNVYACQFIVCEVLNFLNVFLQMRLTNKFLDYEFTSYGLDVWRFMLMEEPARTDPMVKIFPKVTKCTYYEYGPSGTVDTLDALCILPLNNLNEKIFAIFWFWLVFVWIITFCQLIYRLLTIIFPCFRETLFVGNREAKSYNKSIRYVMKYCNYGDWFVLSMLKKNINGYYFEEIVKGLAQALTKRQNEMRAESDAGVPFDSVTIEKNASVTTRVFDNSEISYKTLEKLPSYEDFQTDLALRDANNDESPQPEPIYASVQK